MLRKQYKLLVANNKWNKDHGMQILFLNPVGKKTCTIWSYKSSMQKNIFLANLQNSSKHCKEEKP